MAELFGSVPATAGVGASSVQAGRSLFDLPEQHTAAPPLIAPTPAVHARARRSDPITSALAAGEIEAIGAAAGQRGRILAALCAHPGATARELAALLNVDRYQASRRLPELRRLGFVTNGPDRVCEVGGLRSQTWLPASVNAPVAGDTAAPASLAEGGGQ